MKVNKYTDFYLIREKLNNKEFVDELQELYKLINTYTYFDLSEKNYKCINHKKRPRVKQNRYNIYETEINYRPFIISIGYDNSVKVILE